jgi:hypothetical protein
MKITGGNWLTLTMPFLDGIRHSWLRLSTLPPYHHLNVKKIASLPGENQIRSVSRNPGTRKHLCGIC